MKPRLTTIYTKTGDNGTTGRTDHSRIPKDHLYIEAIGTIDELSAQLGLLSTEEKLSKEYRKMISQIQQKLLDAGTELSSPNLHLITENDVLLLEEILNQMNLSLPPLNEFLIPGGSHAAAQCHVTRTVCRRAERRLVALSKQETLSPLLIQYSNRLSDLLFVMARTLNANL